MKITYRYYRLPNTIRKAKLSEKEVRKLAITTAGVLGRYTNPRGGVTEAHLHLDNGAILTARVTCSYQDNFNKKTGRKLVLFKLQSAINNLLDITVLVKALSFISAEVERNDDEE
jgi:hypothetical protein